LVRAPSCKVRIQCAWTTIPNPNQTSLAYDRGKKLRAYARRGIGDYWIVDLTAGTILVHREPSVTGYAVEFSVSRGERLAFESFPDDLLLVDELLPAPPVA
jgi:Uma2 family endonuclease